LAASVNRQAGRSAGQFRNFHGKSAFFHHHTLNGGCMMGRLIGTLVLLIVVIFGLAWAFGFVNLRQTRDASLPKVEVTGGQPPKFDLDVSKVNVGTKNESVSLPKVDVGSTEKNVQVPTVDVEKPKK
jgi:hypothetical protein